jgi:hypothetical protein
VIFLGIVTIKKCWVGNLEREESETSTRMGGEKSGGVQLKDRDEDGRKYTRYS